MKTLLIILLLFSPSRQVEQLGIRILTEQISIFPQFENQNFVQRVNKNNGTVQLSIRNMNYLDANLDLIISRNDAAFQSAGPHVREIFSELYFDYMDLGVFINHISDFLRDKIKYWDNSPFKTPEEVIIYKRTNCIGYSALFRELLYLVDIKSEYVSGFYLKKSRKGTYDPIPHRWLEIFLPDDTSFFFDPQYQGFKANYILITRGMDFRSIEKFKIKLLHREKKLIN